MIPAVTEVLVIGGGNAGLCAAITARQSGARVLLLEKGDRVMRGGNTRHTRNLRVMHNQPLLNLDGSYSEEEYWQDLLQVTGGKTNKTLARLMINHSEELLIWLQKIGVHYQPALSGTLGLNSTNAFFLGGGKALVNTLYRVAERVGVDIIYNADVRDLELNGYNFVAASGTVGDRTFQISANAVVVASGGFQANSKWMKDIWGQASNNFLIRGTPKNTGLPLISLINQGVNTVSDPSQCHAIAIDARGPRFDGGIVTRLDCVCFSIVVNDKGQRFYDEGEDFWPKRYAIWGRLIASQPDQIAYAIFDEKVKNNFMPSIFEPISGKTIAELAKKLDVPATQLEKTVLDFNQSIVQGIYDINQLDSCRTKGLEPPKSHWALPIDTAPYYAYPLKPGITFTYLGLEVDSLARVQFDNEASPNIYAAGEIMAGNILGQGYCAGTGMTIGGVFGRIAGKEAADWRTR